MKTTVNLSDALVAKAKRVAANEGITIRELIDVALGHEVAERQRLHRFRLRDASFTGNGLQPEFRNAGWEAVRDAIDEGPGA